MTKILIIEDEQTVRENILELLETEGFEVIGAENGATGINLALSFLPDLIICDVMMPELDGFGVLESLRQNHLTDTIPFIFLTAKVDPTDLRKGMALGADDYLTKPTRSKDILQAIATRLEKQAAIERQQAQKLDELRSNITLALPHELRTPLNGILGYSELLIADYDEIAPSERLEMLEGIRTSGQRLYRLIQNFLLYAELELILTDPKRLKSLQSEQTQCVKTLIADQAMQQARAANREADLHLKLVKVGVKMSSNRFNKLIEELVQNAFKFSSPGTSVMVKNKIENDTLILSIQDKGRGMSSEQIARLGAYQQFERKLYEQQGSGLGLMIAKRLSELYSGTLTIESIPNQETTVIVTLPICSNYASDSIPY